MPRRDVEFRADEFYHVYNRGANRQQVFFERENYGFFLKKLREFVVGSSPAAEIVAYYLMPNHYHLLVKLHDETFSKRMQSLGQSYVNSINKRCSRVGPLFQGRFRAKHVDREAYLLHLTRYVHLNPVVAGLVKQPRDWDFRAIWNTSGYVTARCRDPLWCCRSSSQALPTAGLSRVPLACRTG
jgi:REP element-mobilizing transposase RayT